MLEDKRSFLSKNLLLCPAAVRLDEVIECETSLLSLLMMIEELRKNLFWKNRFVTPAKICTTLFRCGKLDNR